MVIIVPKLLSFSDNSEQYHFYYIKNKDKVLAKFYWDPQTDDVICDDTSSLPTFISNDISGWLDSRTPPKYRAHMVELLQSCGLESTKSIIDFAKGLSLIDTLWVTDDLSLQWKDENLFTHEFKEIIASIAFDGRLRNVRSSTTSPEFGTDGMLAKCWIRDRETGKIQLVKTGTTGASNAGNEPLSENLASQVLDILGYPHVKYTIRRYKGHRVSVCDLFTSETEMLLPIYRISSFSSLQKLEQDCSKLGVSKGLAQHLVFDYLSMNTDRHAGNFGCLLDADTYKVKSLAPIYDNGASMLCYWNGERDLDDYSQELERYPALYKNFTEGAIRGKRILKNSHNVQRLINFKFEITWQRLQP